MGRSERVRACLSHIHSYLNTQDVSHDGKGSQVCTCFVHDVSQRNIYFTVPRHVLPLGMNVCPPFHSIARVLRAPSIIPPAKTVIGDETRRNTFWLAYCVERLYSAGNGWAMSLDDQDVSQLLPVTNEQFEQGVSISFPEKPDVSSTRMSRSSFHPRKDNGRMHLACCSFIHLDRPTPSSYT